MKIAHISDIHWRGSSRHEEYTKAFSKLFEQLKEEKPDLIVCTGDIFHTKTQGISPEVVSKMVWMFQELFSIAPVRMILGNHDCFTGDHEVLTRNGWKPLFEVVENKRDEVATFNENNQQIEFQLPSAWISKYIDGNLLHLCGKEIDALVTPGHEFLYSFPTDKHNSVYRKSRADLLPKFASFPINGILKDVEKQNDFAALLGFAFADGTFVLRNIDTNACRVQFHFKKERKLTYLKSLLDRLGYHTNFRKQKDGTTIVCVYEELAKNIFKFFDGKKEIPQTIYQNDMVFLRSFLVGYLQGDGSGPKNKFWKFSSISKTSRDTLVSIARLVGCSSHSNDTVIYGNYENSHQQYQGTCNFADRVTFTKAKSIKEVKFSGNVYCVTVGNGNLLIRRNGKIYVAGNCNLANPARQDAITPILQALNAAPKIFLYKASGNFIDPLFPEINWSVFSCVDKDGWSQVQPSPDKINIALFHGSIIGCQTDGGFKMMGGEESVSFFTEYDYTLLGDIHKCQSLSERQADDGKDKGWIAYPGSLIQQNFGEEETKGYLIWDIRGKNDWDIEFKPLLNYQPFLTFNWLGDFQQTINVLTTDHPNLLPGTRFRAASTQNISDVEKRQLTEYLIAQFKAEEVVFKIEVTNNLDNIQTDTIKIQKTSLRNNPDILVQLYNEYILNNLSSHPLSEEQMKAASDVINQYLVKLNASEPDVIARDISWSLKSMDFDNIFRYGEGNSIDFTKLNGIVGVFGPNRTGKSSLIGTMMYALFNATDRGPIKTAHIINENKTDCRVRAHVNIGGNDYVIERTSTKDEPKRKRKKEVDNEKTSTSLTVTQVNPDGTTIPRTGISRDETDKELRRLIGTSEDFLLTSFASQGDMNRFINEGATERKAVLSRFLDLDIFKKLCDYAKEDCTNLNTKTKRYSDTQWEQLIEDTKKEIQQLEASKLVLESRVSDKRTLADELRLWIAQKEKDIDMATILQLEADLDIKERQVENANRTFNETSAAVKVKQAELLQVDIVLQDIDVNKLETRQESLADIKEKLAQLESSFKVETTTLEHQEKSIKKLDLVPCGDSFPQCHFIRDSHENKQKLAGQRQLVQTLKNDYESLKKTLDVLITEKISDKIKEHRNLSDKKLKIETNLRELKTRQKSIDIVRLVSEREHIRDSLDNIRLSLDETEEQEIQKKKDELRLTKTDLDDCESQKNDIFLKLGSNKQRLEQFLLEKEECFDILQQLQIYESVYRAFSKNGIPAMILKNQLPAINAELEKILTSIVDFKISLETDTTANVMDVFITYPNGRRIIETASGMEKMIASLALRVALTNLSSLPRSDIFILDEGFGPLDDNSIYQCLQLMSLLKSYFRVILVITHIAPIKEIADRIIDIKDEGQYSFVQV